MLQGPALQAHTTAQLIGQPIAVAIEALPNPPAVGATYQIHTRWLKNRYFGEEQQQKMQTAISMMRQESAESPEDFWTRIQERMQQANLTDAEQALFR